VIELWVLRRERVCVCEKASPVQCDDWGNNCKGNYWKVGETRKTVSKVPSNISCCLEQDITAVAERSAS
jgi:hypothetical protein